MPVIKYGVQEILAVNRIPPDFLYPGALPFGEDHFVEKLITLLYTDVLLDHVVYIVIRIQDFHLDMKKAGLAFDPHKIAGMFVVEFAVDVNRHVGTFIREDSDS